MTYLWEKAEWPSFYWTNSALLEALVKVRHEQGKLLALGQNFVHSFEVSEQKKAIFADLFEPRITEERLMGWQASLFPTGFAGIRKIKVGELRTKDLVRSSLPSKNLHEELSKYLRWWNEPPAELDLFLRSAMAFYWFILLSPFEDGNYQVACALAEKVLQESEKTKFRPYDIALQLEENEDFIMNRLRTSAEGNGDLTNWMLYFLELSRTALSGSLALAQHQVSSESFWKRLSQHDLNQRQRKILNLMFDSSLTMTNRSYVEFCKTSRESAKRDLAELVELGLLQLGEKKGRSVEYSLIFSDT
ncbi:MAG: DUF4172 domain-containing protein [Pseudobdellovibrio sp.]